MFINSADSSKLVRSVQRDYRKAAEDHRQLQEADTQTRIPASVKVGLALTGIISLLVATGQFAIV
jgi:hypothetical protein